MIRNLTEESHTAKKLIIKRDIKLITPFFIPSFSGVNDRNFISKIKYLLPNIPQRCILISAYDYYKFNIIRKGRRLFEDDFMFKIFKDRLLFLDSGGFEIKIISDKKYTINYYDKIIDILQPDFIVSYDCELNLSLKESIKLNLPLYKKNYDKIKVQLFHFKEGDIKKELSELETCLLDYSGTFDILGLIDNELGSSLIQRVSKTKHIKKLIEKNDLNIPIHIFGCSDLFSISQYYFNGIDLFDGTGWFEKLYDFKLMRSLSKCNISNLECDCTICKNVDWENITNPELENMVSLHNLVGYLSFFDSLKNE